MKKILKILQVRESEKVSVLYFLSLFFVVGSGMAMGKASADALFFKRFGIEYLPLMFIALGILLAVVSLVYAAFADKISAEKFFFRLFVTLIGILITTWWLVNYSTHSAAYPAYFLIYEAASEVLLIHAALYLSQNMDSFKFKRLSPIIFAGSQLGMITGGLLVALLAPIIGTSQIILVWCILLLLAAVMIKTWHRYKGPSAYFYIKRSTTSIKHSLQTVKQGISFTRKSSLLKSSSMAFFFLVITFYMLYYISNQVYTNYFKTEESLTSFFGVLTAVSSFVGLLLQVAITNRAIDKIGVRKINLIFPISLTIVFAGFLISLKLSTAILASFIKDAFNPAFNTPVRNMMFNVLPKNIQGRARAVSIGIILPSALFICAIILLSARYFNDMNYFILPGFIASCLFLFFSFKTNRAYMRTLIQHLKEQVYLPENTLSEKTNHELLESLEKNIHQSDDKIAICCAKILIKSHPKKASEILSKRLITSSNDTADQLIRILADYSTEPLKNCLQRPDKYPDFDQHIESTLLQLLFDKQDVFAQQFFDKALSSDNPRMCATGIYGVIAGDNKNHIKKAIAHWINLSVGNSSQLLAVLQLAPIMDKVSEDIRIKLIENYKKMFIYLLLSENTIWQAKALRVMSKWSFGSIDGCDDILFDLFKKPDPYLRAAVVKCFRLLEFSDYMSLLIQSIEDGHPNVRNEAMKTMLVNNQSTESVAQQWINNNASYITPRAQLAMFQYLQENGLSQSSLKQMAATKTQLTRHYYDAMQILKNHKDKNTAYFLTYTTVCERVFQASRLLLNILQYLEQVDVISVVKAAMNSADKRLIASACEALKGLKDKDVSDMLIDVLQDDFELKMHYVLSFKDVSEVLNWCQSQDEWLHECAGKALKPI